MKTVSREDAVHTAGSASQIADGAAATLLMRSDRAQALGLEPLARVKGTARVGWDPVLMPKIPIPTTQTLPKDTGLSIGYFSATEASSATISSSTPASRRTSSVCALSAGAGNVPCISWSESLKGGATVLKAPYSG